MCGGVCWRRGAGAIDQGVGRCELAKLSTGETGASQTNFVETDDHRGAPVERDEWGHVANDTRQSADHREPTDTAELVDRDAARNVGFRANGDVTAEHRAVGHDYAIGHGAIVGDVCGDHEQAAVADLGDVTGVEGTVNRTIFAEDIAIADFGGTGVLGHVDVLRHAAEHRAFEHDIVTTELRSRFHGDTGGEVTVVAQHDSGFNNTEGADMNVRSEFGVWTNNGERVNRHRRVLSEGVGCQVSGVRYPTDTRHPTPDT